MGQERYAGGLTTRKVRLGEDEQVVLANSGVLLSLTGMGGRLTLTNRRLIWTPTLAPFYSARIYQPSEIVGVETSKRKWLPWLWWLQLKIQTKKSNLTFRFDSPLRTTRAEAWIKAIERWRSISG